MQKQYLTDIKIKMLIYHLKANLNEKILSGEITRHLDPEIKKMLVIRGMFGNKDSSFRSGP